jgi:peroxiredoxin
MLITRAGSPLFTNIILVRLVIVDRVGRRRIIRRIAFWTLDPRSRVPVDDGAADHLTGARLPNIALPATNGTSVRMCDLDNSVVFTYPRTGTPDRQPGPDWDAIPGARGCTPHSCGFRDLRGEFDSLGIRVLGLSTQTTDFQKEFVERIRFPFLILSDAALELVRVMRLPTFEYDVAAVGGGGPNTLLKRMAWYIEKGVIRHVWYPVFPPDKNADVVFSWLASRIQV